MITIVIICGNSEDSDTITKLLCTHRDFQIAAWGKDGYDALHLAETLKPNVMIMDLYLSGFNAAGLAPILKRKSPGTALMTISNLDQNHQAGRVITAGIAAYLLKQEDMDKLAICVQLVCSGGHYINDSIMRRILNSTPLLHYFPGQLEKDSDKSPLSASERRIIMLITQCLSNEEIAVRLGLKEGTVRNCITGIKRKTGTKSRVEIAFYALIHGLIHFEQIGIFRTSTA